MDQSPTAPGPPFPPPSDDWSAWTPTVPLAEPPVVLPSAPPTGRVAIAQARARALVQMARAHVATFGWAVLLAVAIGVVVSGLIGIVPFTFGDRGFWDAEIRFLIGYWYIPIAVIVSLVPVTFVGLRDGADPALDLVIDRRYWRVLVAAAVILPAAVAVIVFVASHLLAVVLTIAVVIALFLILVITGAGF